MQQTALIRRAPQQYIVTYTEPSLSDKTAPDTHSHIVPLKYYKAPTRANGAVKHTICPSCIWTGSMHQNTHLLLLRSKT